MIVKVSEHHIDIVSINTILSNTVETKVAAACGVTLTQYRILLRLAINAKPTQMIDLAKQLFLTQSAITTAVNKLEGARAVRRVDDPEDRRIVYVELLAAGIDIIRVADQAVSEPMAAIRGLLDQKTVTKMFQRCAEVASYYEIARVEHDRIRIDTAFVDTLLIVRSEVCRATKEHGLSVNEYRVLYLLSLMHEGGRPSQISYELALRTNDTTVSSNKLVAANYVKRSRDPKDRRASILEITNEGYELIQKASYTVVKYIRHLYPAEVEILDTHDSLSHTLMNRCREGRGL